MQTTEAIRPPAGRCMDRYWTGRPARIDTSWCKQPQIDQSAYDVSATSCREIEEVANQIFVVQFVARLCNKVWHTCNFCYATKLHNKSPATKVSCVISL